METSIKQVEDLYESNPLGFNDEAVNYTLDKIERKKI